MSFNRFRWLCILVVLGVSVGHALLTGIPLEDLNVGTLWDEIFAGRRVEDLVESAYFTDRQLTGSALDPRTVPKIDEFQATNAGAITFFLTLKKVGEGEKGINIRTRWYDEEGVERTVVRRLHRQRGLEGGVGTWTSHVVAGSVIAQHPGRWTVKLSLDGRAAGEFHFRVVSPGQGGVPRPSVPRSGD